MGKHFNSKRKMVIAIIGMLLLMAARASAHTLNYSLANAPNSNIIWFYLKLGYQHIIPDGTDHILFVAGLCLLSTEVKAILWQATAFTVAHSITLALSMKNIIVAPGSVVEPIIALSIMFIAVENLIVNNLKPWRLAVVFLFGLIHGMGFASALNEIGLPPGKFFTSIIAFNAGVELGQLTVIAAVFTLIIIPLRQKLWYKARIVLPLSLLIAVIAGYWLVQRL